MTPESLARDVERLVDMESSAEFADAMASFQHLFGQAAGGK